MSDNLLKVTGGSSEGGQLGIAADPVHPEHPNEISYGHEFETPSTTPRRSSEVSTSAERADVKTAILALPALPDLFHEANHDKKKPEEPPAKQEAPVTLSKRTFLTDKKLDSFAESLDVDGLLQASGMDTVTPLPSLKSKHRRKRSNSFGDLEALLNAPKSPSRRLQLSVPEVKPLRLPATFLPNVSSHHGDEQDDLSFCDKFAIPRLVRRDLPFSQSSNKVSIGHNQGKKILPLLRHDWFHVFLRIPSKLSLLLLLAIWTGVIILFALLYMWFDHVNDNPACSLGLTQDEPIQFGAAFSFSLETCTTVGYGLPSGTNAYFESCGALQFLAWLQMVWSMLFNAFLFAFMFTRFARSELRGSQVVHSRKCIVSIVDGQVRWQCRVYDIDARHPVVEAHVRLYVIMKERPVPRPLRILQPDDEYGAALFMSFPTVVSHHVDIYSLLHPPTEEAPMHPAGLVLRQVDASTGNRDEFICPACGDAFGSFKRFSLHVRYNTRLEAAEELPLEESHRQIKMDLYTKPKPPNIQALKRYFENNVSEIICVVEGIDPIMSGTFQALQSYTAEDVIWDERAHFAPCIELNGRNVRVDLDRFHEVHYKQVQPVEPDTKDRRGLSRQVSRRPHDSLFAHSDSFFTPHDSFQTT